MALLGISQTGSRATAGFATSHVDRGAVPARPSARIGAELFAIAVATGDFCLIIGAAAAAYVVYFRFLSDGAPEPARYAMTAVMAALGFVALYERGGGYQVKQLASLSWQGSRGIVIWTITIAVVLLVAFIGKISAAYSRVWMLAWTAAAPTLLCGGRLLWWLALARWLPAGCLARRIAVVGTGGEAEAVIAKLEQAAEPGFKICGLYAERAVFLPAIRGQRVLGTIDDLIDAARHSQIDEVIVALPLSGGAQLAEVLARLKGWRSICG